MLLTTFLILIDMCVPLNYLTCEKNGTIEMQHNNNNNLLLQERTISLIEQFAAFLLWQDEMGPSEGAVFSILVCASAFKTTSS